MSSPQTRFTPAPRYLLFTLIAFCGSVVSLWVGFQWMPAYAAAVLFAGSALATGWVALRPRIEIHDPHLQLGKRRIPWDRILSVDYTGWDVPLAVRLIVADAEDASNGTPAAASAEVEDAERILVIFPGDAKSSAALITQLRRRSKNALIDGMTYREFWGEPDVEQVPAPSISARDAEPAPSRYPVLSASDEEDVERLFQQLKEMGRLESKRSEED